MSSQAIAQQPLATLQSHAIRISSAAHKDDASRTRRVEDFSQIIERMLYGSVAACRSRRIDMNDVNPFARLIILRKDLAADVLLGSHDPIMSLGWNVDPILDVVRHGNGRISLRPPKSEIENRIGPKHAVVG